MTVTLTSAGASVPNWTLVSSNTPNGVTSVSFTGLAGYSKYRLSYMNLGNNTAGSWYATTLTLNGDTSTNYAYSQIGGPANNYVSGTSSASATGISLTNIYSVNYASNGMVGNIEIENALLSTAKYFNGTFAGFSGSVQNAYTLDGVYKTSSALTSITFTISSSAQFNNTNGGTFYLYGAN
jgi:hypothetical protein